jgi:uncharacterized protein (DUF488 family)
MVLFTIGYEGLDQRIFLAHLAHHGVDVVADIRKLPLSRKRGFSKTALQETLSSRNIGYINFRNLGAPKDIRDELYQSGNYNRFFRKYKRNISNKKDLLKSIYKLINDGQKVTLFCFERDPQKCHRKVVAEEIKKLDNNGLKVKHIIPI